MKEKKKIYAVVGPTASGKSRLAIDLAKILGGEIVCLDSMQIYRSMSIGTAAPTKDDKKEVPHRLFAYRDPKIAYSCSDYAKSAARQVRAISARGSLPIFCGGTGLYFDSLLYGVGGDDTPPDPEYRKYLTELYEREGAMRLHEMLASADPEEAKKIHPNNVKRVIRALEICREFGTKTEKDRAAREKGELYEARVVGLRYADRTVLVDRIDRRVEKMFADGLVEETERLMRDGVFEANATAAQAIGYKEILPYLRGEITLPEAKERLCIATRQYAKRQMTWFSAKPYVNFIDCDGIENEKRYKEIVKNATEIFQKD